MGSTPSFVAADNWPAGKHPDVYQEFADSVAADIQLAMKGFAPICARGSADLKSQYSVFESFGQMGCVSGYRLASIAGPLG